MIPGNWGMGFCGFGISTLYYVLLLVHDLHWISHDWESGNSLGTGTSLLYQSRRFQMYTDGNWTIVPLHWDIIIYTMIPFHLVYLMAG